MFFQILMNGLLIGAIYTLIALGFTLFFGILDVVQFAQAEIFMIGAFAGLTVINMFIGSINPFFLIILVILGASIITSLISFLFGRITVRPLRNAPSIMTLVATLTAGVALRYLVMVLYPQGSQTRKFPRIIPNWTLQFGEKTFSITPIIIIISTIILVVVVKLFLDKTKIGMAMRAVAQDVETASIMGVNVNMVTDVTFIIAGTVAAIGGILYGIHYGIIQYDIGEFYGPICFAAAVIGGLGNIYGSMIGGFLLGFLVTFSAAYIPGGTAFKFPIAFIILLIFLVVKPSGILGSKSGVKV